MKIRDIIRLADLMLGTNIGENILTKQSADSELTNALSSNKELGSLVKCANLVLSELAEEYLPLITKQTVNADGVVLYSAFDKSPVQIVSAKQNGNVKYVYRPEGVEFEKNGSIDVVFSYRPLDKAFLDDAEIGSAQLGARTVAYGVCAEYCLLGGNYEEAQIWDRRYKDNLLSALSKKSEISVKQRRWC